MNKHRLFHLIVIYVKIATLKHAEVSTNSDYLREKGSVSGPHKFHCGSGSSIFPQCGSGSRFVSRSRVFLTPWTEKKKILKLFFNIFLNFILFLIFKKFLKCFSTDNVKMHKLCWFGYAGSVSSRQKLMRIRIRNNGKRYLPTLQKFREEKKPFKHTLQWTCV